MIRVHIERDRKRGTIKAFSVAGHAYYGEPGQDIVCAGVSAVTIGTVNAVERLAGVALPNEMREGLLKVRVPALADESTIGNIQLLLESMVVMLESIQESYGSYIALKQTED